MRIEYKLRIHKANRERKQYGITMGTYIECYDELCKVDPEETMALMIENKQRVIDDARQRAYYLVED